MPCSLIRSHSFNKCNVEDVGSCWQQLQRPQTRWALQSSTERSGFCTAVFSALSLIAAFIPGFYLLLPCLEVWLCCTRKKKGRLQEFLVNQAAERLITCQNTHGARKQILVGHQAAMEERFQEGKAKGCLGQGISTPLCAEHKVQLQQGMRHG